MRISNSGRSSRLLGLALAVTLTLAPAALGAGGTVTFKSAEVAYQQGMSAYRSGYYEHAIPALNFAAEKGNFLARFYLARIYSDNSSAHTDHAKAYHLYKGIADEFPDIDPTDDRRAPFVAKALTSLARYVKNGLREIGLQPDAERAAEYLDHSANWFNDEDAQFELAKLYLAGEGVPQDQRYALHYLSVLTQRAHAGAQAFLADLYWRGQVVKRDTSRAYALISLAVENAPLSERIWIEDIHQNIFCGASEGTRRQAEGMVADWRKKYVRENGIADPRGSAPLQPNAMRECGNGESVTTGRQFDRAAAPAQRTVEPPGAPMKGGMMGFTVKDAGVKTQGPAR